MKTLIANKKQKIMFLGLFTCLALNSNWSQNDFGSRSLSSNTDPNFTVTEIDRSFRKNKDCEDQKFSKNNKIIYKDGTDDATNFRFKYSARKVHCQTNNTNETNNNDKTSGYIIQLGNVDIMDEDGKRTQAQFCRDCSRLLYIQAENSEELSTINDLSNFLKDHFPETAEYQRIVSEQEELTRLKARVRNCEIKPLTKQALRVMSKRVNIEDNNFSKVSNIDPFERTSKRTKKTKSKYREITLTGNDKIACEMRKIRRDTKDENEGKSKDELNEIASKKLMEKHFNSFLNGINDTDTQQVEKQLKIIDIALTQGFLHSDDKTLLNKLKTAGHNDIKVDRYSQEYQEDKDDLISLYNEELELNNERLKQVHPYSWEYAMLMNNNEKLQNEFRAKFEIIDSEYRRELGLVYKDSRNASRISQRAKKDRAYGPRTEMQKQIAHIHKQITKETRSFLKQATRIDTTWDKNGNIILSDKTKNKYSYDYTDPTAIGLKKDSDRKTSASKVNFTTNYAKHTSTPWKPTTTNDCDRFRELCGKATPEMFPYERI